MSSAEAITAPAENEIQYLLKNTGNPSGVDWEYDPNGEVLESWRGNQRVIARTKDRLWVLVMSQNGSGEQAICRPRSVVEEWKEKGKGVQVLPTIISAGKKISEFTSQAVRRMGMALGVANRPTTPSASADQKREDGDR